MKSTSAAIALLLASSSPAAAQTFMTRPAPAAPTQCAGVPIRGDLVVLSMYGGKGAALPYSLEGDQNGGHAVAVNGSGSGRITLVVSSYESTVWDLSAIKDRVAGVLAYGYYPQGISGLNASTPVAFSTLVSPGNSRNEQDPCFIRWAYEGMYKIQQQADQINSAFGTHPRRWYGGYSPTSFNVDGGQVIAPGVPRASSVKAGVTVNSTGLMPGNDGLEQLVQAGALRRFAKPDIDQWSAKGGRLEMTGGPYMQMRAMGGGGHDPLDYVGQTNSGYLALKSLKALPAGLGGADAVIFVVPEGLSVPESAGHSTMYRLSGYPGRIPPPGPRPVPIDMRAQMITQSAGAQVPASMYVEWDASGRVVKDGTRTQQEGETTPVMISRPQVLPPISGGVIGDEPTIGVQEADASRDMTPSAMLAAILLIGGGAGLILNRRRTGLHNYPLRDGVIANHAKNSIEASVGEAVAHAPVIEHQPPEEVDAEIVRLSHHLQEAIDLSLDDGTALVLIKFKRVVLRALQAPAYDEDLAIELDAIVEKHLVITLDAYVKAARRVTGPRLDLIETNLREGVKRLTERVDEIIEEQSARDAEQVTQRGEFIQARHPHAGNLGDLH